MSSKTHLVYKGRVVVEKAKMLMGRKSSLIFKMLKATIVIRISLR